MKKRLISMLAALAMLLTLIPSVAFADVVANGTTTGWEHSDNTLLDVVTDTVDGVERPVLRWTYQNSDSTLSYNVGQLPAGYYEIALNLRSGYNPGEGKVGLMNDSEGGFPGNAPSGFLPRWEDTYQTISRVVEITEENSDVDNALMFYTAYGDNGGEVFIADAALRQVAYNADGETYHYTGVNLIKNNDFQLAAITEDNVVNWITHGDSYDLSISGYELEGQEIDVLEWSWSGNGDKYLDYAVDTSEPGVYEVSIDIYSPRNAGTHRMHLDKYTSGVTANPGEGVEEPMIFPMYMSGFDTIRQLYVIEEADATAENLVEFHTGWGEAEGSIYIKKLSIVRIGDLPAPAEEEPEEPEPEIGTMEGWACGEDGSIELVMDTVNDVQKPVLKWTYNNQGGTAMSYAIGKLPGGSYQLDVTMRSPHNPGEGRLGMLNDSDGGFPSNCPTGMIPRFEDSYQTVTRTITINDDQSSIDNEIMFYTAWGSAPGELYVSDISLRFINPDGSLGYNRATNADFTLNQTTTVKGNIDGWESDTISLVYDMVKGYEKPVLAWDYANGNGSVLYYTIGRMQPGTYEIAALIKSEANCGEAQFGLLNDVNGGFPGNSEAGVLPKWQGTYETTKLLVTVDEEAGHGCDIINKLCFRAAWGDAHTMYISEISVRPVTMNADGETYTYAGENIVANKDFSVEKFVVSNVNYDIIDEAGDSILTEECTFIPMIPFEELGYQMVLKATIMNAESAPAYPVLFVAVYDGDRLTGVTKVSSMLAGETSETWSAQLKLPEEITSTITARGFVWDGISTMKAISNMTEVSAQE